MISDLITNLIQDMLSEYTFEVVNNLVKGDKIRKVKTHYWDENSKCWMEKQLDMLCYSSELGGKEEYYLLVPKSFTAYANQKDVIMKEIFNGCIYSIYEKKILSDENEYGNYIHYGKNSKKVYKKAVANLISNEFSKESVKKGNGYITTKGLLDLVKKYPEIRDFIKNDLKK